MPSVHHYVVVALAATAATVCAKPVAQVEIDGPELHFPWRSPPRVPVPAPFTLHPWSRYAIPTPARNHIREPASSFPVSLPKRSSVVTSTAAAPSSDPTVATIPCGCWNDCTLAKLFPDAPSSPICPMTCRPEMLCDFDWKPFLEAAKNIDAKQKRGNINIGIGNIKRSGTGVGNGVQELDISVGIGNIKRDGSGVNNGVQQLGTIIGVGNDAGVADTLERRQGSEMHCYPFPCEDVLEPLDISTLEISYRPTGPHRRQTPTSPPTGGNGEKPPRPQTPNEKPRTAFSVGWEATTSWGSFGVTAGGSCTSECKIGKLDVLIKTKF